MSHDERADESRGNSPAGCVNEFSSSLFRLKLDVECLSEILTKMVRSTGLDRAAILNQSLNTVGVLGPSEFFGLRLEPGDNGYAHPVFCKSAINFQHRPRLGLCFIPSRMRSVPFLPKKLRGSKE